MTHVHELSEHERHWRRGCAAMRNGSKQVEEWERVWSIRRNSPASPDDWSEAVLSHHVFAGCGATMKVPIEPLVGFLRHPRLLCFNPGTQGVMPSHMMLSKEHLLLPWRAELPQAPRISFLFDLGASMYDAAGRGGTSTDWFLRHFERRGIVFDRVLAWEPTVHPAAEVFRATPDEVYDVLSYYNIGVSSNATSRYNPWRTLRHIARPNDFVVIKMDIDNFGHEYHLVEQLIRDPANHALVDEFYFEEHVRMSPTFFHSPRTRRTPVTLFDSYNHFSRLRELGIRAHPWV